MTRYFAIAVSLFLAASSCAQEQLDVTVSVVTYQQADSAEVLKQDRGVIVIAEGLKPTAKFAAKIKVVNQNSDYIEVFPQKNPFPPLVVEQFRPGEYLIQGEPGEKFNISVRSANAKPVWLVAEIPLSSGETNPPASSELDLEPLKKVVLDNALATKDAKTARALAASLRAVDFGKAKTVEDAVKAVKLARAKTFNDRDFSTNWAVYLSYVDAEYERLKIKTVEEYRKAVLANADALDAAAAAIQ